MLPVNDNPFAILTAVVAPAILTNACSVLALGTANRIARVVDRSRVVIAAKNEKGRSKKEHRSFTKQLKRLRRRGNLLLTALRFFYAALGMFAASALSAVIGSAFLSYDLDMAFHAAAVFGFLVGSGGVIGIVVGCFLMVRETRFAVQSVEEEHDAIIEQAEAIDDEVV